MRSFVRELEERVLLTTSAGNENEEAVGVIYPGARRAQWNYSSTVASRADADFSFATDAQLWEPTVECPPGPCFPSLTMGPQDQTQLDDLLSQLALTGADAPGNILIVGAVDPNQNLKAGYSELGADLTAVGTVPLMEPGEFDAGTSVAAPQVAGLASYLWRISPELRNGPVADTIGAILANNRGAAEVIDAYATVLSLDPVGAPDPATWHIRRTLLDVDNDGGFDEGDLQLYVEHFYQAPAYEDEVNPAERDYSVHDLNGDGYTGGNRLESFDLDRTGSSRYGAPTLTTLQLEVGTERLEIDENNASDLDILCWYAWSPLYEGDPDAREEILANRCFTISVTVDPANASVQPGGTVQFAADVSGTDNPAVDWALPDGGGTISDDGLFTAGNTGGSFTVRAISEVDPNAFGDATVEVGAGQPSGVVTLMTQGWTQPQENPITSRINHTYSGTITARFEGPVATITAATGQVNKFTELHRNGCISTSTYSGSVTGWAIASYQVSGYSVLELYATGTWQSAGVTFGGVDPQGNIICTPVGPPPATPSATQVLLFSYVRAPDGTVTGLDFNVTIGDPPTVQTGVVD